jgi:hypothetical protein
MSFALDPEVAEALAPFAAPAGSTPPPPGTSPPAAPCWRAYSATATR